MKAEQLSIFLENKPGRLAAVMSALAENNINLRALSLADTLEFGVLRLIVNRPAEAREAISQRGFQAQVTEVLAVEVPNQPGGLSRVLNALAAAGVNVEYMYAFAGQLNDGGAVVIFRLDDTDRGLAAIPPEAGRVIPKAELYQH
ncbi:MAG: ACT domain-containing protein [Candidatus Adiutrix sp.]|jgi:hypothetical protein|nr:ACT domain-containing protein [Candidatus Adiutrix sp.]